MDRVRKIPETKNKKIKKQKINKKREEEERDIAIP